jgi:hypothetical protein
VTKLELFGLECGAVSGCCGNSDGIVGFIKSERKRTEIFDVLLTVHLSIILVINQLNAQTYYKTRLCALTCSFTKIVLKPVCPKKRTKFLFS